MTTTSRRLVLAGAAVGAAALGASFAWRRANPPVASAVAQAFWAHRFPALDGSELDVARWRGKPLLVNFWATWCAPCVKELPEINQFYGEAKGRGWQVLGLAVDQAEPVKAFLQKTPLDFAVALAGPQGLGLVRELGNPAGGLPFSVIFDETGEISWRRLGVSRLDELRQLAKS
ncbi:TlpA family protein disulfide reductase [Roseateles saccharophilus]|uniref:Thiol-disulfide isomerase/thioredoxin n=1 Tax=Roseateles saccharophilus TaxID=304 RepID=A0A4V6P2Q9_ROSSA|nr:TlpA disulfide reductase family protein [Roseateles saccharophilus]MDG0836135.1 TlpA family protein disulfide reductase [Roseateles saccharophilus]TCU98769.1 thiol-disulfide isomerase/thioredoxin [Roseateles saccharophilus]